MEQAQPGTDSTRYIGQSSPEASMTVYTRDGVAIPLGSMVPNTQPRPKDAQQAFGNNEYIVYDEAQVCPLVGYGRTGP